MAKSISSYSSENLLGVSAAVYAREGFGEKESCLTDQKPRENFPLQRELAGSPHVVEHHWVFGGFMEFVGLLLKVILWATSSFQEGSLMDFFYPFKEGTLVLGKRKGQWEAPRAPGCYCSEVIHTHQVKPVGLSNDQ